MLTDKSCERFVKVPARFHSAVENPGCLLGCNEGQDCLRHYNQFPTLFRTLLTFWSGTGECIPPTAIFNDLLVKFATRSDRLCILVSGLLNAFVTEFNLRRPHQGHGLDVHELMHGRIKMTALCSAWAHTYLTKLRNFPNVYWCIGRLQNMHIQTVTHTTVRRLSVRFRAFLVRSFSTVQLFASVLRGKHSRH